MRILYVAKHGQASSSDDEGAITHALRQLGHEVDTMPEVTPFGAAKVIEASRTSDLLLFHKWFDPEALTQVYCPKVFWWFDLVDYPDPVLRGRNTTRKEWMSAVIPKVDLGFCTDGDWAKRNKNKLVWLTQGADERFVAHTPKFEAEKTIDVLFVGTANRCGKGRESFVDDMKLRWGDRFRHVFGGYYQTRLSFLIASAKVVVAPDHPVTDSYWSNRVYLTCGFGGFLLHPYAERLEDHYTNGKQVEYYETREELHDLIDRALRDDAWRTRVARSAWLRTVEEHTYRHRVTDLLKHVSNRLGVK